MRLRTKLLGIFFLVASSFVGGFATHIIYSKEFDRMVMNVATMWYIPIVKVSDGDSIRVKPLFLREQSLRLIGIDTPESESQTPGIELECFGPEASKRTEALATGKTAWLSFDPNVELFDRHGRLTAYVFLNDGTFLNKKLIEEGFAEEWTYGRSTYRYQEDFIAAEENAKKRLIGRWGKCGIESEKHPAPKTKKKRSTGAAHEGGLFT